MYISDSQLSGSPDGLNNILNIRPGKPGWEVGTFDKTGEIPEVKVDFRPTTGGEPILIEKITLPAEVDMFNIRYSIKMLDCGQVSTIKSK